MRKNIYELPWQPGIIPQIEVKPLYEQMSFPEKVWIERWQPGTALINFVSRNWHCKGLKNRYLPWLTISIHPALSNA